VIIFDEVDAYPPSAGNDGDPIELGTKRAEYYWDRKILAGSTPLIAGASRIEQRFNEGDQRRFYVPCPHCDHFDTSSSRSARAAAGTTWSTSRARPSSRTSSAARTAA
jgi:phage terminase large subunit GpA-like protein